MMLTHPDDWVTRESHAGNGAHDFSILGHSDTPTGAWKVSVWSFMDSVGVRKALMALCQVVSLPKSLSLQVG